jgi:flavin reductase (DIM6/NTAB) family NADH-FMN oxidoreductase RutF
MNPIMHHTDPSKLPMAKALGKIPSGIFVLTAKHNGKATAMLASWVQQASFAPPAISVAISKDRPIGGFIRASGKLGLSIVPKDDTSLMKRYARGVHDGEDPFAGVTTMDAPSGVPVLKDALAYLEAKLIHTCDFNADHELFIAQVTGGEILRDGVAFAHQRGNGFHY